MYKVSKLAAGSVIAATAAVAGASVALADGYEPRRVAYERPSDWSGVYFGVGSGYQWSSIDVHQVPSDVNPGAGSANPGIGISSNYNDAFVSAHIGAQHQFGAIVLGIEGGWMSTLRDHDGSSEFCDSVPAVLSTPIISGGTSARRAFRTSLRSAAVPVMRTANGCRTSPADTPTPASTSIRRTLSVFLVR
jgi:hypothetical protein